MPIRIACPCGKIGTAPEEYAGRKIRCKACGAYFIAGEALRPDSGTAVPDIDLDDLAEQGEAISSPAGRTKDLGYAVSRFQVDPVSRPNLFFRCIERVSSALQPVREIDLDESHLIVPPEFQPNDTRPFCLNCKAHVSPQVSVIARNRGAVIVDMPGPLDAALMNSSTETRHHCSLCGSQLSFDSCLRCTRRVSVNQAGRCLRCGAKGQRVVRQETASRERARLAAFLVVFGGTILVVSLVFFVVGFIVFSVLTSSR